MILIESKVFLPVLYFLYQKNFNETGRFPFFKENIRNTFIVHIFTLMGKNLLQNHHSCHKSRTLYPLLISIVAIFSKARCSEVVLFYGNNTNICTVIDLFKLGVQVFGKGCGGFHFYAVANLRSSTLLGNQLPSGQFSRILF